MVMIGKKDVLGVVYTPVEIVDFMVRSVDDVLVREFGVGLDGDVEIIDPFTGLGVFVIRLLEYLSFGSLVSKYVSGGIRAFEVDPDSYRMAKENIEGKYRALTGRYEEFRGIELLDTFASELGGSDRVRVIISNPPYFAWQRSENDGTKSLKYDVLDSRIRETYSIRSSAKNKNSLYDAYVRAFRWASDNIGDRGVICFISNGSYIDSSAAEGIRKCFMDEFSSVYCLNLRGNFRKGDKGEGGNVFGNQCGTTVAISLLVKGGKSVSDGIHYKDIGDGLSTEQKIEQLVRWSSMV